MDQDIKQRLTHGACDTLGFYPAGVHHADGTYTTRTLWQEGWNEAVSTFFEKQHALWSWYGTLSLEDAACVTVLLRADALYFGMQEGAVTLWLLMNDTFDGAADGEDVPFAALGEVCWCWEQHGQSGLTAWAASQRQMEPLAEWRTPQYYAACETLRARRQRVK